MSTTTKGSPPDDAAPCGSSALGPVAIGDTFERVGKGPDIWEVTAAPSAGGVVRLGSDLGMIITDVDQLADPKHWRRMGVP